MNCPRVSAKNSARENVVTQIGTSRDFQLKQAILIYEDQVSQREKFATVHQVTSQGPDQQASLGPGTLLTTTFLERLRHGLQRAPRAMLLPENVLACTSDLLVWWTTPRQRRMFVISCVDTRAARLEITKSPLFKECVYWPDLGNAADGGQFVLGQPKSSRNRKTPGRLPTVAELFPEIVTPLLDTDTLPSCSAIEALERQEPFINQTLAYQALAMLARLFRHGKLTYHGGFVNLASGRIAPLTTMSHKRQARSGLMSRG